MISGGIVLNGREYPFKKGQTILDVARQNRIDIPTLCYFKGVVSKGSCNICVVEVKGVKDLVPACSTEIMGRMDIRTESPRVVAARKKTLKAILESGNHNCSIGASQGDSWTRFQLDVMQMENHHELCPKWGDCELQDLAYRYQVQWNRTSLSDCRFPRETVNPLIIRDFSRCILCGRCVAACNDIQVNQAIRMPKQTENQRIIAGMDDVALKDSDCVFCGECVQACPVGALVEKKFEHQWRPWEIEKIRTTCPYCGVGCQLWLHVKEDKILKVTGVEDAAPNKGRLCVKGRFGFDFIYSQERLTTPLIKKNGAFQQASWDEALDLVAEKFKTIIRESGPDALAGVSCARSINEDSYQMQKLFRAVFKTNNIDHCART
ncbi:NADH-ubiquinone oxidoreductase-G iron-sulfur binding region [Desulfobacula phenolica]|uniref:NADH-ubiquinone oxidoreductase-G iron-sulfur binding region n=3 Tax=Desulfobacula phenolica TaxID=90732 RepID=A0A1H2FIW4_9BACT|nr:NADH-ubiquinone oxidoreductase-G iron-sulfur binding region [Desulfobacula phenolica]